MSNDKAGSEELHREIGILRTRVEELERAQAEHRREEESLRRGQELYRSLIDNSTVGVTLIDTNHVVRMTNAAHAKLVHSTVAALVGGKCFGMFEKRDQVCPHCPGVRAMATGQPAAVETEGVRDDGSRYFVRVHAFPAFSPDGAVTGFVEVVEDISDLKRAREAVAQAYQDLERKVAERTAELQAANDRLHQEIGERKEAEQAMRESEQRFRMLTESNLIGVCIFQDGIFKYVNPALAEMLGYRQEELLGFKAMELVHPEDRARVAEQIRQRLEGEMEVARYTCRLIRKSGELIEIEASGRRIQYQGSPAIMSALQDITDRKRAEEERDRFNIRLQEAHKMEAIGRLAGGIAHDFNNLMATILGRASHLRAKRRANDPDRESLACIEDAAETAGRLAHQLLVYAKGGNILPRLVSGADVVTRAVHAFKSSIPKGVSLDCKIAPDLGQVECDATQVEQVITNLCRNAVEAMPGRGRLTIRAENVAMAAPPEDTRPPLGVGEYVRVSVTDSGCGMDEETAARVCEPFFTTKAKGYGLGLAAAYGTVKAHRGAISLKTLIGKGTTFQVWLPRVRAGSE